MRTRSAVIPEDVGCINMGDTHIHPSSLSAPIVVRHSSATMTVLSVALVLAAIALVAFIRKVFGRKNLANLRGPEATSRVFGKSLDKVTHQHHSGYLIRMYRQRVPNLAPEGGWSFRLPVDAPVWFHLAYSHLLWGVYWSHFHASSFLNVRLGGWIGFRWRKS